MFNPETLQKIRDGGMETFASLYRDYAPFVFHATLRKQMKPEIAAKNVYHTFITLYKLIRTSENDLFVCNWLNRIDRDRFTEEKVLSSIWDSLQNTDPAALVPEEVSVGRADVEAAIDESPALSFLFDDE